MERFFLNFLICLLLVLSLPLQPHAQHGTGTVSAVSRAVGEQEKHANPLFVEEEVLRFKLSVDMKAVLKDRGEERGYHPAEISYKDQAGTVVSEKLKVKVRGKRRRDPAVCGFPPLLLNFKRSTVERTVFGKVNKVKMVTHCIGDEYVLREYLVYKAYNALTDTSFRVRLCLVEYEDVQGKRKPETRYAFLLEDEDDLAARCKATILPDEMVVGMEGVQTAAMSRLAFFQYMVGNTDWSVPYRHNIILLATDALYPPVPVPYDFDYTGMVDAPYAAPPPELGISSVRQRLFRGYSYSDKVYSQVKHYFNRRRTAVYDVYLNCEFLGKRDRKKAVRYLDQFYKTLNNPKDFENAFVRQGQRNEKNRITVKGLE